MTELSTNSGINHVLCQIETVSSQSVVHMDTVYLKRNLIMSWNCLIIFQFEYLILHILCCNNSTAVLKFQASNYTLRLILYYLEYFTLLLCFMFYFWLLSQWFSKVLGIWSMVGYFILLAFIYPKLFSV